MYSYLDNMSRQGSNKGCYTVGDMQNNSVKQNSEGEAKAKPEVIKIGLDLHARQVTECRQLDGSTPKPAQKWDPWKLLNQVEEWLKAGSKVYSCYEAGACGYWYHRELIKCGAVNYVVAPRVLENQRSKHQKTDRLDARALLDNLESYLRGNRHAMSIVAVPSPELEKQRCVVRYREQLMRNRRRAEARGRALALSQGIVAPGGWWRPAAWQQFKTQLPEWMDSQLEHWQQEALAVDAKERQVRGQIEKRLAIELPIGVGALSWMTLELEIRGWERFENRRQIASYTGLCPGIHNSNGRGREGSINRCGNSVVRYLLIEMVWRLLRWQPDYPPIKKLRTMASKRAKRRWVVAVARRLAIDLWRWSTGRATAEALGLRMGPAMTAKK
jgi:transposase